MHDYGCANDDVNADADATNAVDYAAAEVAVSAGAHYSVKQQQRWTVFATRTNTPTLE